MTRRFVLTDPKEDHMAQEQKRNAPGISSSAVLDAVLHEPGLHPYEYATTLKMTNSAVSATGRVLASQGLLRREGKTMATRYYPTAKATMTAPNETTTPNEPTTPAAPKQRPRRSTATKKKNTGSPKKKNTGSTKRMNNGIVMPELLAALGIEPTPAALLGISVLIVEGKAYRVTMEPIG